MTEKQSHDFMLSGYEETGENIPELISLKLIEKIKDGRWEVKVTVGDGEPRQKNILNKIKELQRKQKEAYYGYTKEVRKCHWHMES